MTATLERRLRQMRSRILIRGWDYRQRRHARGVWFRLRRLLADASDVYALARDEANTLLAEGHKAEPVGAELEPAKLIVFVPAQRVAAMSSARPLAVRLSADLLEAEALALVPFEARARAEGPEYPSAAKDREIDLLPSKVVGRRREPRATLQSVDALLRTVSALRRSGLAPGGLFRFKTFEEAQEWIRTQMSLRSVRQRSKTSAASAAPSTKRGPGTS